MDLKEVLSKLPEKWAVIGCTELRTLVDRKLFDITSNVAGDMSKYSYYIVPGNFRWDYYEELPFNTVILTVDQLKSVLEGKSQSMDNINYPIC